MANMSALKNRRNQFSISWAERTYGHEICTDVPFHTEDYG
tara:strand:+ start:285 stop:404 length:120 start_codon:yes stop_codon:yes gene_type:complete